MEATCVSFIMTANAIICTLMVPYIKQKLNDDVRIKIDESLIYSIKRTPFLPQFVSLAAQW